MKEATALKHPVDTVNPVCRHTLEAIDFVLENSTSHVLLKRKTALLKAEILGKQLQKREDALHAEMPQWMQKVIKGKKILLWEELLKQYHYDDLGVVNLLKQGVDLSGVGACPDCFEVNVKPPVLSRDQLLEYSRRG